MMTKLKAWIRWHLFIWRHWSLYKEWKGRREGKVYADFRRGCGYYLTLGLLGHDVIKSNECVEFKMKSGKVGLFKLVGYERYRDPDDMTKWSDWMFLGYKGETPVAEMSLYDFASLVRSGEVKS